MHLYEKKGRYIIDFADIPGDRAKMPEISVQERRHNFKEVETGFAEEVAVAEAKRCLSCRRCLGCALCWAECKPEAINFDLPDQYFELKVDKVILTSGMERRIAPIAGNINNKHMNIVTDLQVERMLADTGPSSGLILRPQDGEIPRRIAFVQTFGTTDNKILNATLIFGINEAITAVKRVNGGKISFISPNMAAFRESHGSQLDGVSSRVHFIHGSVLQAVEVDEEKNIEIHYETGGSKKADTFDLVVLLTQLQLTSNIEEAARHLGLGLDYADFLDDQAGIVETDKPSILLAQDP